MRLGRRRPQDLSAELLALRDQPADADERSLAATMAARRTELASSSLTVGDAFEAVGQHNPVAVASEVVHASAPPDKALLLHRLVRRVGPGKVVELGSAFGISGAYFVAGLAAAGGGHFVTIDAAGSRSEIAGATIALVDAPDVEVELVVGLFDDHLHQLAGAKVVYVDGNHYATPTRHYLEAALAVCAPDALLLLDDIDGYSPEMDELWSELCQDARFRVVGRCGDLGVLGLSSWA